MGFAEQVAELDELAATGAAPTAGYSLEVLTPKVLQRVRAALANNQKVASTGKDFKIKLTVTVPLDLAAGGADIVEFEDTFVARKPRLVEFELAFPPEYPDAAPPKVSGTSSTCFRDSGSADEFRTLLEGYLDSFTGSPCVAAAVAFTRDNAAPLLKPQYCACFLDLGIDGTVVGRLVLELSTAITPKTTENFRAICTGEKGKCKGGAKRSSGVALDLCYRGTSFVRVIPGQFAHGGDLTRGGQMGGTQGESIYGVEPWADENHTLRFDRRWVVAMANGGPGTNGSQFFVTFKPMSSLDTHHVVFGVVRGATSVEAGYGTDGGGVDRSSFEEVEALMGRIAAVGTPSGKTKAPVVIMDCGQLAEPYT